MADNDDDVEFECETIEISTFRFDVTTISHLPIEMLMYNQSRGVEISGQKVWCGSLTVVDYIMRNKHIVIDKIVIELGAGTGVLGMVCSRLGCKKLILTDNDPRSITHMKQDCDKNAVVSEVKLFDWFYPDVDVLNLTLDSALADLCIVAGDVLYKNILLEPFFRTVRLLFDIQKKANMYLCHVPRAGVEYSDVIEGAKRFGLGIEEIAIAPEENENARKYCPEDDTARAKLFRILLV